jgi:hypothetical protein
VRFLSPKITRANWTGGVTQVIEHLVCKHEVLSSNPSTIKKGCKQQVQVIMQGKRGNTLHCWWECKLVQLLWKGVLKFLRKLKRDLDLPYSIVISLLGLYQEECKSGYNRDIYIPMFIEAQFKITKL